MGSFSDVTESQTKCYYPQGASCYIRSQTLPDVTVESKSYFSSVSIAILGSSIIKALRWNNFEMTLKNLTNSKITAPVKILEYYKDLYVEENKKGIILEPNESTSINFRVYPDVNLDPTMGLEGNIIFNTLNEPYTQNFTVISSPQSDDGDVIVNDITPIADGKKLKIVIKVTNYYPSSKNVDINITPSSELDSTETLPPFGEKIIEKIISPYEERPYGVIVTTPKNKVPTIIYSTIIYAGVASAAIPDENGGDNNNVIIIDNNRPPEEPPPQQLSVSPEIIAIVLVVIVGLAVFIYFLRKPRYV
jgi:hypothetical protein